MNLGIPLKEKQRGWVIGGIPSFPAENQQARYILRYLNLRDACFVEARPFGWA